MKLFLALSEEGKRERYEVCFLHKKISGDQALRGSIGTLEGVR